MARRMPIQPVGRGCRVTFTDPIYLLLLIPAIAWVLWLARGIHGMARARRQIAVGMRILLIVLIVFALAGAQSVRPNRGITTVFVLDRSASMDSYQQQAEEYIRRCLQAQTPGDQAGLVVFGKEPLIDTNAGSLRSLGKVYSIPDESATDIAASIRLASAMFASGTGRRIVLVTDGNETTGDAAAAADVARADGIQIDYVPPPDIPKDAGEVILTDMSMPTSVTKGEPFDIHVSADSSIGATGYLDLDRDGTPIGRVPVRLNPGANSVVVSETAGEPGFYRYRAVLDTDNDTDPRNNIGLGYLEVKGRPRILLIAGKPATAQPLAQALEKYDLDVVTGGSEKLPTAPEDLQTYDSVLLSDFDASLMTDRQMQLIASSVRDSGIGFGMIGGESSFLPGGYYDTPIAEALPVDLNVRDRKEFPSTTICIVIDTSGSMGMIEDGEMKVKIAASAAAATVNSMSASDYVGVAGSTDEIAFVAPIQRAVDKEAIDEQIGKLDVGGGGIYIEPSLEFAQKALRTVHTRVKHLILLSDGDDAEQQEGCIPLAEQMVAEGMTISVVAVGAGKDEGFLHHLADVGRGQYYLALKAHQLERLMTRDSSINSRSAIEEGAFIPKVDPGDEALRGLSLATMPPLYAYDVTSDRPLARTPMRTAKNDPLLAFWQYGLGTSMAFTSDAQPKWARPWLGWHDFPAFWSQVVRSTMRQASTNRVTISTHRDGDRGVAKIEAADPSGNPLNGLPLEVHVMAPDGKPSDVAVRQVGPGKYEAGFEASNPGGYMVSAVERSPGGPPRITRAGFSIAYPPEYQAMHPNTALLAEIAQTTGGKSLETPVDAFRPIAHPGESSTDLWPALLLAAAILAVLDIATRRLAIPFDELWQSVVNLLPARLRRRRTRRATAPAPVAPLGTFVPSPGQKPAAMTRPNGKTTAAGARQAPTLDGGGGLGKVVPEEPRAPELEDEPVKPKKVVPLTTAEKLLASKKSRQGGGKDGKGS